jgi:hypothetical protein
MGGCFNSVDIRRRASRRYCGKGSGLNACQHGWMLGERERKNKAVFAHIAERISSLR